MALRRAAQRAVQQIGQQARLEESALEHAVGCSPLAALSGWEDAFVAVESILLATLIQAHNTFVLLSEPSLSMWLMLRSWQASKRTLGPSAAFDQACRADETTLLQSSSR